MTMGADRSTARGGDVRLWLLWKQVSELVRTSVIADVTDASDLSEPELTVLVNLNGAGGSVRQNALGASTGWDRTRLSHLLTRIESRGWRPPSRPKIGVAVPLE